VCHSWFHSRPNFELLSTLYERVDEVIVNTALHEQAVRADVRLSRAAEFASNDALDSFRNMGIVEDNEGCVAAKPHRHLHHPSSLLGDQPADTGSASEADLLDDGIGV
jgi:hypothetical protein